MVFYYFISQYTLEWNKKKMINHECSAVRFTLSITFSIAGYGDITPKTTMTKMIVIYQLFVTISLFEIS